MRTNFDISRLAATSLCLLVLAPAAGAQVTNATITGVVKDGSGAAVTGAQVHVQNLSTNAVETATTNSAGVYTVGQLLPGPYSVTVEKDGFNKNIQTGVSLTVGQVATLNVALQVGSPEQAITVSGGAQLIDTNTGEISEVVNQRSITELPLNGRNPASLVFLTSGVTNVLQSSVGLSPGGTAFPTETNASAGGGRQGSTFYLLDGARRIWIRTCLRLLRFQTRMPRRNFA